MFFASCAVRRKTVKEPVTLTVLSWNDDFREIVESYLIPRYPELMENVTIHWVTDEINGYRDRLLARLDAGEPVDLFLGDNEMAPWFAASPGTASLRELGLDTRDLAAQYRCTRLLGSDGNGVQKGSAMTVEPGVLLYRTDYAAQYLGITRPEDMQARLSTWEAFLETASQLREKSDGKIRMLPNATELWRSVNTAMSGRWLSDGRLSVSDDALSQWMETVRSFNDAGGFLGVNSFSDEWYNAIDDGVFCVYAAPWMCKSNIPDRADITTVFSSARQSGVSFGRFGVAAPPVGFLYGGTWLYGSAHSSHKELVGQIIRACTCDADLMREMALRRMEFVNHTEVCRSLGELKISNPLFDGLDAFSVYRTAAEGMDFAAPSVYDGEVSAQLLKQARAYAKGEATLTDAVYRFRLGVWKLYPDITDEPQPPQTVPETPQTGQTPQTDQTP